MGRSSCLNQTLLLAVIQAPVPLAASSPRTRSAINWVRTITSTSSRHHNFVSFGPQADAALDKYLNREPQPEFQSEPPARQKTGRSRKPKVAIRQGDDYEINDFVDRSSPSVRIEGWAVEGRDQPDYKGRSSAAGQERQSTRKTTRDTPTARDRSPRPKLEPWQAQRNAMKEKFPEGWSPRKKLSPDAMEGIRGLHAQDSVKYSTAILAEQFKISPEAIRRILRSKWMGKQAEEKMDERRERWAKRHDRIWDQKAELGLMPRRKKPSPIEDPDKFEKDMERKKILGEI
ncbi:Required for respiratory growth protein 9 mitochondrial [Lithohypha guttulata]|uniref:Required for respiratory growth protein 9 mitochondrial n=1 Tax=Lithohypha guttulata TaxID=1690604 RepID=UPI002DE19CAB|nr:Required for respiratory growth protein 9 mitochondrial [Lithohypha guttulata]